MGACPLSTIWPMEAFTGLAIFPASLGQYAKCGQSTGGAGRHCRQQYRKSRSAKQTDTSL
jgi:hypothetical protein